MPSSQPQWRQHIVDQLSHRNRLSSTTFADLIQQNNRLYDSFNQMRQQIAKLTLHNELLREKQPGGSQSPNTKQINQLQRELHNMQLCQGHDASRIETLKIELQNTRERSQVIYDNLDKEIAHNRKLLAEARMLTTSMAELKRLNGNLCDETIALQLALNTGEAKWKQTKAENEQLVERLLQHKALDVSRLNEDNDLVQRQRAEQMQRDLEEALNERTDWQPNGNGTNGTGVNGRSRRTEAGQRRRSRSS